MTITYTLHLKWPNLFGTNHVFNKTNSAAGQRPVESILQFPIVAIDGGTPKCIHYVVVATFSVFIMKSFISAGSNLDYPLHPSN